MLITRRCDSGFFTPAPNFPIVCSTQLNRARAAAILTPHLIGTRPSCFWVVSLFFLPQSHRATEKSESARSGPVFGRVLALSRIIDTVKILGRFFSLLFFLPGRRPASSGRGISLLRALSAIVLTICLAVPARARGKAAPGAGRDYPYALAAADQFLHAWQSQDQETGLLMLSDAAKRRASEDSLAEFFAPGPGAAYEIGRGKVLKGGRYSFPVVVYSPRAGKGRTPYRRFSEIIIGRSGKDDWVVDRLP